MSNFSSIQPKKVLFIATRQIGDVLVTTPLISKARELWPEAEFHFLGYRGKLDMLKGNPEISELIETSDRPGFAEYLSLFNRLFQSYDLAIVTQPSDRAYLYGLVSAFRRVGILGGHPQGKEGSANSKTDKQNAWKKFISMHNVTVDYFAQHVIAEKLRLLEVFFNYLHLYLTCFLTLTSLKFAPIARFNSMSYIELIASEFNRPAAAVHMRM